MNWEFWLTTLVTALVFFAWGYYVCARRTPKMIANMSVPEIKALAARVSEKRG